MMEECVTQDDHPLRTTNCMGSKYINDMTNQNGMLCGFANSMFQSSKLGECGDSNWSKTINDNKITGSDVSYSHWEHYESDINTMKHVHGMNSYRFSIEWSHVEPKEGKFNSAVLHKYKNIIDHCLQIDIQPMITLHHFNEPLWFYELGGFSHESNIKYFVRFCKHVYSMFHNKVSLWCTINEPAIYAFMGYLYGKFPPQRIDLQETIDVLKHLLMAHVSVYSELKKINQNNQIGIVHNVLIFKPLYKYDFVTNSLLSELNIITNELVITFFTTGSYIYDKRILFHSAHEHYHDSQAILSNDFFGLNFYANPVIGPNLQNLYGPTHQNNQIMGDMYLPIDPEGFSDAIDIVSNLKIPIYITETGIADESDILRPLLIEQYMNVIKEKKDSGINIFGCYFWTFRDNYEWGEHNKLFGFYDKNNKRKESCNALINITRQCAQASGQTSDLSDNNDL